MTGAFLVVFFAYLASFVLYFLNFELQNDRWLSVSKKLVALALLLHFAFLLGWILHKKSFAITSLFESIYVVSFLVIMVSYLAEQNYRAKFLMLFSLPIVLALCLLAAVLSQKSHAAPGAGGTGWLLLHTGFILAGLASLVTAVSGSVMYLLQSSQLKSKHLGRVFLKLPSLNSLDRLHFRSLCLGVVLFSLGILSGIFWANNLRELGEVLKDPKVILSFFTCFLYWVVLSFRLSSLRRGQKIAAGTVVVFLFLLVTLMSSYYAPSGFHKGF